MCPYALGFIFFLAAPQPKRTRVEVVLLYFGLCFLKTVMFHTFLNEGSTISLTECNPSVQESIEEDLRKLKAFQNDFCDKGTRCFKRVSDTNIFVFLHGTHLACSKVLYSMFYAVLDVHVAVAENLEVCDAAGCAHVDLQPFCRDNRGLLKYYEKKGLVDKKTKLKQCENLAPTKIPLQYSTGGGDLYLEGYQMSENIWTERLKGCLDCFLPVGYKVELTAEDGKWFTRTQTIFTGLPMTLCNCYPFHGSPDLVITRRVGETDSDDKVVVSGSDGEEEEELIENAQQLTRQSSGFIEKVGQLLATIQLHLAKKVLKSLIKEKTTKENFCVQGLLIQKLFGCVLCKVSIQLKNDAAAPLIISITTGSTQLLSCKSLCFYLQKLLSTDLH